VGSEIRIKFLVFLIALTWLILPVGVQATVVRMQTSLGVVDIELYNLQAPQTVTNFLKYVNRSAYNNSFIHRSDPRSNSNPQGVGVIQGGGYAWNNSGTQIFSIPTDTKIDNEFSMVRPNVRGTIAMAKVGGDPDSATSQWFVNLVDNTIVLGVTNNGGFTVFGEVMANGMAVVDAIAALSRVNAGGAFATLPLVSRPPDNILRPENLVMIASAAVLPTTTVSQSDRLFNYLEAQFFEYVSPASQPSETAYGYYYRYYPDTISCVGIKDDLVYYAGPLSGGNIVELGTFADWFARADSAGY
jgi:peptidyl-prolyl cis-trans isomerase A (cyclophilin A)